jgi:hypothetical protein
MAEPKTTQPELPDKAPSASAGEGSGGLRSVLTPERVRVIAPIGAALVLGILLGVRVSQHLSRMGTPAPAPEPEATISVFPRQADCAECAQRAERAHEANVQAVKEHPLVPPSSPLLESLSEEERAYVAMQLAAEAAKHAPRTVDGEPLITVGMAPPIHDVP